MDDSLKLNEKMKSLLQNQVKTTVNAGNEATDISTLSSKRIGGALKSNDQQEQSSKKARLDGGDALTIPVAQSASSSSYRSSPNTSIEEKPVQKLKYIEDTALVRQNSKEQEPPPGYRVLVATFSNVEEAACGDASKLEAISAACDSGGNYLEGSHNDSYYYQYEVLPATLEPDEGSKSTDDMSRLSMAFNSFLQNTPLPQWHPLGSLHSSTKILSLMSLKRDNNGKVKWNSSSHEKDKIIVNRAVIHDKGTKLPMQPRKKKQERLGGRLLTDRSWRTDKNQEFPIELGAQWIHGINDNPLASLATVAGIHFVTASEEVKMLAGDMKEVDSSSDERLGELFDRLLDHAADGCWKSKEDTTVPKGNIDPQATVRFYGSAFIGEDSQSKSATGMKPSRKPNVIGPPPHRRSNDRSMDCEIGKAIREYSLPTFCKLTIEEHRILLWYIKNVEYAMNANMDCISSKFWDVDEVHAFDGEHVLLRQGYSKVIDFIFEGLKAQGDRFELFSSFHVGKIEYGRNSTSELFGRDELGRDRGLAELSDTCSVSSTDGKTTKYFDFLVCAVPLGVLKESVDPSWTQQQPRLSFTPALPFAKVDAIQSVGFGLLNKVYVRFQDAFWRTPGFFKKEDDCLFGNASGVHPHHYMFFDVGRRLAANDDAPAVLMSLVSGKESVEMECKSDTEVIEELMQALRAMFSPSIDVPAPVEYKITRWGQDRFSRGSYSFLPPGSTDQDYEVLKSSVCASGDSLLLGGTETMRLFFAGEHTTALHPSTAHGAMLSGVRAAQEVVANIQNRSTKETKDIDKTIPVAVFRYLNPRVPFRCALCHKAGGQIREGALLAFTRGTSQCLVHNNCAEYSPEVEVVDGKFKNVLDAVSRGKNYNCEGCTLSGATISCAAEGCYRSFHFSCAEDFGWRFDRDGKEFFCDLHRKVQSQGMGCDRISLQFFRSNNSGQLTTCSFCSSNEDDTICGEMLAFQSGRSQACAHENCLKYTTLVDTTEIAVSRMGKEFTNVFGAIEAAKECTACSKPGATIACSRTDCLEVFHFSCALKTGFSFDKKGKKFACPLHRIKLAKPAHTKQVVDESKRAPVMPFQHNLLSQFGAALKGPREDVPGNLDIESTPFLSVSQSSSPEKTVDAGSDSDEESLGEGDGQGVEVVDIPLSSEIDGPKQLVRIERPSQDQFWNMSLKFERVDRRNVVSIAAVPQDTGGDLFSLQKNDVLVSLNGSKVGTSGLSTLRDILKRLSMETDIMLQVVRK
ncbi:MAG: hypothetical protein SGILL_003077 [Bacillariaceae sp.]